jgi:hypothetical protein
MTQPTSQRRASFTTVVTRSQNVAATAVALSGVTQQDLRDNKQNFLWLTSDGPIRYRWDGQSPTTSVGHVLPANTQLQLIGTKKICAFRFIGAAGAAAIVTFSLDATEDTGGLQ